LHQRFKILALLCWATGLLLLLLLLLLLVLLPLLPLMLLYWPSPIMAHRDETETGTHGRTTRGNDAGERRGGTTRRQTQPAMDTCTVLYLPTFRALGLSKLLVCVSPADSRQPQTNKRSAGWTADSQAAYISNDRSKYMWNPGKCQTNRLGHTQRKTVTVNIVQCWMMKKKKNEGLPLQTPDCRQEGVNEIKHNRTSCTTILF